MIRAYKRKRVIKIKLQKVPLESHKSYCFRVRSLVNLCIPFKSREPTLFSILEISLLLDLAFPDHVDLMLPDGDDCFVRVCMQLVGLLVIPLERRRVFSNASSSNRSRILYHSRRIFSAVSLVVKSALCICTRRSEMKSRP